MRTSPDFSSLTPAVMQRLEEALNECTEILVIDFEHGTGLACDLPASHGGTLHHDPVSGARWRHCILPDCGHASGEETP